MTTTSMQNPGVSSVFQTQAPTAILDPLGYTARPSVTISKILWISNVYNVQAKHTPQTPSTLPLATCI